VGGESPSRSPGREPGHRPTNSTWFGPGSSRPRSCPRRRRLRSEPAVSWAGSDCRSCWGRGCVSRRPRPRRPAKKTVRPRSRPLPSPRRLRQRGAPEHRSRPHDAVGTPYGQRTTRDHARPAIGYPGRSGAHIQPHPPASNGIRGFEAGVRFRPPMACQSRKQRLEAHAGAIRFTRERSLIGNQPGTCGKIKRGCPP